jgi:signal transduction histidine kinase
VSEPAQPVARVLIVDDESAQMKALCRTLSMEGYVTSGFTSPKAAIASFQEHVFDLLLTDLMMPEMDGIELLTAARQRDPHIAGVMMTGHGTIDTAVRAMQAGAVDYIQKPFSLNVVLPVLTRALTLRRLRIENEELTRRVRLHALELEHANAELNAANQELEAFSYSVSHDLRAPLRAVEGYCEAFLEDFGAGLTPEGIELLRKSLEGAERMNRLIDDLLALSRVGRQPLARAPVEVGVLVRRIVGEVAMREPQRQVQVVYGELPDCTADGSLLEQVYVNLISNAFKFTRNRQPGRIEVGCTQRGAELAYFVRDDGAGFESKYAPKLFQPFRRLHAESEFEGTGIGLSIVRRIVQRHGGRVWAEGSTGQGATFWFTVPG